MRAIDPAEAGGPEVLKAVTRPVPRPGTGEVLIRVAAAGVNRPDVLQRRGLYPPPQGAPSIPGLEVSGEIVAAFLWAQLEQADRITERRVSAWTRYHEAFAALEREGRVRRPVFADGCTNNAHMYYLLLRDLEERTSFIEHMRRLGIQCVFHYVPLHSALKGRRCQPQSARHVSS